jgi:hypothetical protein
LKVSDSFTEVFLRDENGKFKEAECALEELIHRGTLLGHIPFSDSSPDSHRDCERYSERDCGFLFQRY